MVPLLPCAVCSLGGVFVLQRGDIHASEEMIRIVIQKEPVRVCFDVSNEVSVASVDS